MVMAQDADNTTIPHIKEATRLKQIVFWLNVAVGGLIPLDLLN